jgi:deazaflavin-dependent oxidoreductase (nitroreductase family)
MPETETETETAAESDAANAWEEQLIADLRANDGRPSRGPLKGHPILLLFTTGAKSGQPRRAVLTLSRDGDDYIVAGTASGSPKTPDWVANLRAYPDARIEIGTDSIPVRASIAEGAERDRLWDQHVAALPWFAEYPSQTGGRIIPMIRLRKMGA